MNFETDLHMHSTFSDGAFSPAKLVATAEEIGLKNIAITDHDSIDGVSIAIKEGFRRGINVISGLELSVAWRDSSIDILGYGVDINNHELNDELAGRRKKRLERIHRTLALLEKEKIYLKWEDIVASGGQGAIGRPHIAWAMIRKGYVASAEEAFSKYLGEDCVACVPSDSKISLSEGIELIHKAKGVAIIAHPFMPEFPSYLEVTEILPEALKAGIDGLEAFYTGYTSQITKKMLSIAQRHNLIVTGGSDFHGGNQVPHCKLGEVNVPNECVAAINNRLQH